MKSAAVPVEATDEPAAQRAEIGELLSSAQSLLNRGAELAALRVLHSAIGDLLQGTDEAREPLDYSSLAEARRVQRQLLREWEASQPRAARSWLRDRSGRRPIWIHRAALVLVVLLSLRYAWALRYRQNWARQHPEGNWISRFYKTANFDGYPMLRYDMGVNADYGSGGPVDAMPKDFFSARWDTCLVVNVAMAIPLQLESDDGSKLYVDERVELEVEPGPGRALRQLTLSPGLHHLRVDFVERQGMAMVKLSGLELAGAEGYSFRRPLLRGEEVACSEPAPRNAHPVPVRP